MFGWLKAAISWLDGQGGFTQAVVIALLGAAWSGCGFVLRYGLRKLREIRERSVARQKMLDPAPRMTLMEAQEAESPAHTEFLASIVQLGKLRTQFTETMNRWPLEIKEGGHSRLRQTIAKQASDLDAYSTAMMGEAEKMANARKRLSDAWSSRMYWHDERGTAKDIIEKGAGTQKTLDIVADVTDKHSKAVDVMRTFSGRTPEMDAAFARFQASTNAVIEENIAFEWTCATVIEFSRQRSGWRGVLRRSVRRFVRPKSSTPHTSSTLRP